MIYGAGTGDGNFRGLKRYTTGNMIKVTIIEITVWLALVVTLCVCSYNAALNGAESTWTPFAVIFGALAIIWSTIVGVFEAQIGHDLRRKRKLELASIPKPLIKKRMYKREYED